MCKLTDHITTLDRRLRDPLIVLLVATLIFTARLGAAGLWDEDEPRNAACAREMLEREDWVVPTFNYELRTQKPVLSYWLMMASYRMFGINEFAARFPSALLAIGTSLLTYHLARMLIGRRAGLLAGVMLATCWMFDIAGRAATPDSSLIFSVTLCLCCYVGAVTRWQTGGFANRSTWREYLPPTWIGFVAMYAALGIAALAKGPVGVLLCIATIGLFLLIIGRTTIDADDIHPNPKRQRGLTHQSGISSLTLRVRIASLYYFLVRFCQTTWAMRPLTLALVVAAIALPWYVLVGIRTDGEWLRMFFGNENLERFRNPMEGHRGPIVYYIPAVLAGFFPWSIFLPLAAFTAVRKCWQSDNRASYLLLTIWAGLWIGLFSLAATKLPSYVLPAYPALAIVTAELVDRWMSEPHLISRWMLNLAWGSLATVGVGMLAGLPLLADRYLDGDWSIAMVGIVPIIGAIVACAFTQRGQPKQAVVCTAVMAVLMSVCMFSFVAVRAGKFQNSRSLIAQARQLVGPNLRLGTFEHPESSVVFYARQPVERCATADRVQQFMSAHVEGVLLTSRKHFMELQPLLPSDCLVLSQQRRFLKDDELLLIGRAVHTATHTGDARNGITR